MPQFIMEGRDAPDYNALDSFTQGYIEALFFTETEQGSALDPGCGQRKWNSETDSSLPGDVGFYDLAGETLERIKADCAEFQSVAEALLEHAYEVEVDGLAYTPERAGHDFWFTRNGHGVGFWSRTFKPDSCADVWQLTDARDETEIGQALDRIVRHRTGPGRTFSEMSVYLGDDGKVYQL